MKKLLCLVFALAMVCGLLFAFSVNAEEGTTNNIASEATITTSSGSWWITDNLKNMVDGKEDTGMHSSNTDRETSVTFTFDSARYVTKIVLKVNGTATTSAISHTDLNANTDYQITINGTTTTLNALDKTELVLDVNASMTEMSIKFTSNWSANNALIREVEIYEYIPPVVEAATGNNIEDDATIAIVDGNDYILGGAEYLRDNDPSTGLSAGDAASWINYHFLYERPRAITKVKVVVNSTGTMYMVGSADGTYVHETMSALPNIYLRLYSSTSGANNVYAVEGASTANAVEVTKDGKTYMEYTFDLGGALYEDIVKVEIATVHNKDNTLGVWEVEIIDFQCQSDEDHKYADATCSTPATCIYCLATTGEPSGEHTLLPANCGQPARCQYCDYTEGDVTGEPHTWLNASYTAPKICKICGTTEGDVWVDSDLEGFIRGPENDMITYDDIVGEVTLINGTNGKGVPEYVLDGITDNASQYWGGPTNTQIKITLKHEWEITDAKLYLFANWASMKVGFYAADGTLLGEKNHGGLQCNMAWFNGGVEENPTYTDYTAAVNGLTYGDTDKAVKYIIITNTADKWGWVPGVVEVYFSGRERIPFAGCVTHNFEATYPVEPTCTTEGTMINKCTVCGAEEAPVVAPALGHDMGEYTIKVPATCTEAGTIEFACKRCGETTERPTHINDVTDYADQYSITSNGGGWTNGNMFDNTMDKFQQASSDWKLFASVDLDMPYYLTSVTLWVGYDYRYDGDWNMTFYYQAPGSDEWIEAGTRKIYPYIYEYRTPSEYTLELEVPVYADAVKIEATGVTHGNGIIFEAEVAGTIYADTTALGHNWVAGETVAPQCGIHGYTNYVCSDCSAVKKDSFVAYLDHEWIDATCTVAKTCSLCSVTTGDPLGHDMSVVATCTTPLSCSRCDYTEGEALGHTWTDATCTAPKTCSACGATEGEALGHSYDLSAATTVDNVITVPCSNECGAAATITVNGTTAEAGFNMMLQQAIVNIYTPNYGTLTFEATGASCNMVVNPMFPAQPIAGPVTVGLDAYNTSFTLIPSFDATAEAPSIVVTYAELTPATIVLGDNTVSTSGDTKIQFVAPKDGQYIFTSEADVYVLDEYGSTSISEGAFEFEEGQVVYLIIYPYGAESVAINAVEFICEHNYEETVYDPSCISTGFTVFECSKCGDKYVGNETPALGHSYVEAERVPAEPGVAGSVTYTCSICGDTYSEEIEALPEHTHTEVEIPAVLPLPSNNHTGMTAGVQCAECGEVLVAPEAFVPKALASDDYFKFRSISLTLQESIAVNYAVQVTSGYTNVYTAYMFLGEETVLDQYKINSSNGRYEFKFMKVFPQLMQEEIVAYVYAIDENGEYVMNTRTYSVQMYLEALLGFGDKDLTTVVSDLLVMGAETQKYLNYRTDSLITDLVGKNYTLTPSTFTSIPSEENVLKMVGDRNANTDWTNCTLELGDTTRMVLKFKTNDIENVKIKITVAGVDTYYGPEDVKYIEAEGKYELVVSIITSLQFNETVQGTILVNGEQVGRQLNYSINSYLYANVATTGASDLVKALYCYGKSVKAYFG